MKNTATDTQSRTITVAELCEALANGSVQAQVEDDMYVVRSRDIARLARNTRGIMLPIVTQSLQASLQRAS